MSRLASCSAASATETLTKTVAGIPIIFLVCVGIAILAEFTLRRGRLGLALRAVGSNEAAAHRMGVNVGLTRIGAYCIAGSFAALAAVMLRMPTVIELHAVPHDPRVRALVRRIVRQRALRGLVAVYEALRRDLVAGELIPPHAPVIVAQVFDLVRKLSAEGYTVLIVEQNVRQVLKIADRAYLLEVGRIKASGPSQELAASDDIRKAYMGI